MMAGRVGRAAWLVSGAFALAGALHILHYRDLPLVRNALVYAHISLALVDGDPAGVSTYGKPVGFPWLASPLVASLGPGLGLEVASWLATSAWALALPAFHARFAPRFGVAGSSPALFCLLVLGNPLAFYQFISAYPDTLFALVFLLAVVTLDRFASPDARWYDGVLFALATATAIWVKHHGFVLLPIAGLVLLIRRTVIGGRGRARIHSAGLATAVALLVGVVAVLAARGGTGFVGLGANWANYTQGHDRLGVVATNLATLAAFLALTLSTLLPCVGWRALAAGREWTLAVVVFVSAVVVYDGSAGNMRYYLAVSPFLALLALAGLARLAPTWRRLALGGFVAVNLVTTAVYNVVAVHDAVDAAVPVPTFDNLRLVHEQRNAREDIRAVNALAADGYGTLVVVSGYYADGTHNVWERDGRFAPGLRVVYAQTWEPALVGRHGLARFTVYDGQHRAPRDLGLQARTRWVLPRVAAVDLPGTPAGTVLDSAVVTPTIPH